MKNSIEIMAVQNIESGNGSGKFDDAFTVHNLRFSRMKNAKYIL